MILLAMAGCVPYLAFLEAVPQVVSCCVIDPDTGVAPDRDPQDGGMPDRFLSSGQGIKVRFSVPMDRETVERTLFFSDEEKSIGGVSRWNDERTLLFIPDEIRSPLTYTLYIGTAARSKMGIPLRSPYTRTFPTTADRNSPPGS
ncbi:MAG: Ig-like domain-containing protein [Spirochaetota bacterium]|nr:Ig-like domain-containing protein [Spirochaetota bacterium]